MTRRARIFTWHIHGSYLFYLSQANFEIFLPVNNKRSTGYIGRGTTFPFAANVHEIPVEDVGQLELDCIIFQTPDNYLVDQYEILTEAQRSLPAIYLEHDPPQQVPTNTRHVVDDPGKVLVHVTHFNRLMWDNGRTPAYVIDHGIVPSAVSYSGDIEKGIVIINNLSDRGRRLGSDVFEEVRKHVRLDLIGMDTEKLGGLGEILHPQLPAFISQYRFFFNPIRYTSLGLAVLEAMMAGVPVVGLATTELVTVIENGKSGYVHTDVGYLIACMQKLLEDKKLASRLGAAGKETALKRFHINRFIADWEKMVWKLVEQGARQESILTADLIN